MWSDSSNLGFSSVDKEFGSIGLRARHDLPVMLTRRESVGFGLVGLVGPVRGSNWAIICWKIVGLRKFVGWLRWIGEDSIFF